MDKIKSNVLQVINLFWSARIFIGGQFSYLANEGFNMHLICSPAEGLDEFAKEHNIGYEAIELDRQISIFNDLKALIKICKYIRRNRIKIIIGHQAKARLLTVIAGKIMRVPKIIIFAHGVLFETSTGIKRSALIAESKFESLLANKVVCVSKSVADARIQFGIDKSIKQIILGEGTCGGIDTKKFNPDRFNSTNKLNLRDKLGISKNELVIGFVGRFVKDKGIPELIEAFKLIKTKYPDKEIKLMLVGEPEKRDSISRDLYSYITQNENIIVTGFVKENIEEYYSIMDIFILPSYREGFPTSVLEASAMKLPIITTRSTGCINSIIEDVTGIFVKISPIEICLGIEKLFSQELRIKMGINGRNWVVANYDHTIIWPIIGNMLKELE